LHTLLTALKLEQIFRFALQAINFS
jgi:hypothetical protein